MTARARRGGAWRASPRFWVSVATAALVGIVVWQAWPATMAALRRMGEVDGLVFALLIPTQLASFAATGEVLFSFLRARGELRGMHPLAAVRMSLEFNFANHMLPSGGTAGIAYTTWKLGTLGVPASRATTAQLVRFAVTFASFAVLLAAASIRLLSTSVTATGVLWTAAVVGMLAVFGTAAGLLLLRRRRMLHRLAGAVTALARRATALVRRPKRIDPVPLVRFVDGLHLEVRAVTARPRALIVPFLWSFAVNALDAGLFWIALTAFGMPADPALVFVAYGAATVASMVVVTPNGVGAYEVVMVGTLVAGGMAADGAIAAIVLARSVLLLGTMVCGWGFYQHSVATAAAPRLRRAAR